MENKYLDDLDKKGYCVIPNIYTPDECSKTISSIWNFLENMGTSIKRDKYETWGNKRWPFNDRGLIQHYRVGHEDFVWDARCHPKVIDAFAQIWKTEKLLVSFDGICVARPPEFIDDGQGDAPWYHTDQRFSKKGKHCIQGFLNLDHTDENDATFSAIEGSHLYHEELGNKFKITVDDDWYPLKKLHVKWLTEMKGLKPVRICAPKGSLVLWDSRTIHCNFPAKNDRPKTAEGKFRYVIYICMTPAEWVNKTNLAKKRKAFNGMRMTTHWPHDITLFPQNPPVDEYILKKFKIRQAPPELSPIGYKLAGLEPYETTDDNQRPTKKMKT